MNTHDPWHRNGFGVETETADHMTAAPEHDEAAWQGTDGAGLPGGNRLRALLPSPPPTLTNGKHHPEMRTLALFCFEVPESPVGQHVANLAAALAHRQLTVHLFTPHASVFDVAGVHVHAVGGADEGDLLTRVDDFTSRACNAFLQQFPNGSGPVALLGHEWSTIPVLSILKGIKNIGALLSLQSLERQRSDLSSDLSQRIHEIELSGLREARVVLAQDQAAAEIARFWVPECGDRLSTARPRFPVEHFRSTLDPGAVKARYQVGPVDPTILYVGDLSHRYGPDLLMKTMPAVLRNNKQARCIFVGDGDQFWPLRVYARYLLLEHAVRLVGHLQAQPLNELIQAADIIVVPSREATPWWPIQAAWAAQRPVVATHAAAPGLLTHEQDSVFVYPTENSIVWGIERILYDAELGRTIAHAGHEKLEERFGWNILAEQIEELLGIGAVRS
jgi:glycosyltransferase involved in cell wall biosynthesis